MQMCKGVQAIHTADGVHRDIKPANALMMEDGSIVVADLGLAKMNSRDTTILTQVLAVVGTQVYVAPEQRLPEGSREADARTDVYQLGKTLYELVTGISPAMIDSTKLLPGLKMIIRRATQEDPSDRYQSVSSMMDAVNLYTLAKDPSLNTKAGIESLLDQVKDRAKRGEYRGEDLVKLMATFSVANNMDDGVFIDLFDKIPDEILQVIAKHHPHELAPVLNSFAQKLEGEARKYSFSYAEDVAHRMKMILATTDSPEIRKMAIEATLIAAVQLGRFAAMDSFDKMLEGIKDPDTAVLVAEMLRNREEYYGSLADRISEGDLAAPIELVRKEMLSKKAKE